MIAPAENLPQLSVFARLEEKYVAPAATVERFLRLLGASLHEDGYGTTAVSSLYLDTPQRVLIRRSIERPDYKEKLRVRTYGVVRDGSHPAYLELKKKLKGVVYKRRVRMTLDEAWRFVEAGVVPLSCLREGATEDERRLNRQIADELAFAIERYRAEFGALEPFLCIGYERRAYSYESGDGAPPVRLTVDARLTWQEGSWDMGEGSDVPGEARGPQTHALLPIDQAVLEVKAAGALPLHLSRALTSAGLFAQSYSKVGAAYRMSEGRR